MTADSTTVDLQFSNYGTVDLLEGSAEDAENGLTDVWINGEVVAYAHSELIGVNSYRLTGLVRGKYNTPAKQHVAGDAFARLDGALYRIQLTKNYLGKTMYCKLPSFNTLKKSPQALNDVEYYTHIIGLYDIPNVSKLAALATKIEHTESDSDGYVTTTYTWDIVVTWTAPDWPDYNSGRVCYKKKGTSAWIYAGIATNVLSIRGIATSGDYIVSVATRDNNGNFETPDASAQVEINLS